ncbi:MAG: hypothetical protein K2W96_26155 [Gemmataceae bacterium]|nr:hypothetical protein [Gemmataceae bacterium]
MLRLHAIFHRLVRGDEALLRLARAKFHAAGLLPEFNPGGIAEMERLMEHRPCPDCPFAIHLPRSLKLSEPEGRDLIAAFAQRFRGQASVLVVHDQKRIETHFDDYVAAVRDIDARLPEGGPMLCIEYAVGLPAEAFAAVFHAIRDLGKVSATVDISHVGIRQCQRAYEKTHPGQDVCGLKWNDPRLKDRLADVQEACATALPVTRQLVAEIAALGKTMHFHLHDGHPASTFSQFGVSDHLSFFETIPCPPGHEGAQHLPTIFGPLGLKAVLDAARASLPDDKFSLTVEVHPAEGRLGLGEHAALFSGWKEKENAERMNRWLDELLRCARLVRGIMG